METKGELPSIYLNAWGGVDAAILVADSQTVYLYKLHIAINRTFLTNPAKVAATVLVPLTTEERAANGRFLRVPDAPRGCRVAQSDGLVRLTILSADGHAGTQTQKEHVHVVTRQRVPNKQQTAPNSRLPKKNLGLFFCAFFHREFSRRLKMNPHEPPNISSKHESTHRF